MSLTPDKRHICVADTQGKVMIAETDRMENCKTIDLGFGYPIQINHILYDEDDSICQEDVVEARAELSRLLSWEVHTFGAKYQVNNHLSIGDLEIQTNE